MNDFNRRENSIDLDAVLSYVNMTMIDACDASFEKCSA
jgi:hypothetical protein